jgi:peptidoglycan/LPS O-acetylase OafA/YrhL
MKHLNVSASYYPALTGLRALAAFAVFGFHHRDTHAFGTSGLDTAFRAVLGELHIGVSIFFTLSGYLITKRYAGQRFGQADWVRYLGHRAARLLPVYVVLLTATFVVHYNRQGGILWRWLGLYVIHLTLLKGLVERWALSGITQAWSLTVEEGFYFLAPVAFWLGWRYRPTRAWPLLAATIMLLGVCMQRYPRWARPYLHSKEPFSGGYLSFY